jgi:hypothetical protein
VIITGVFAGAVVLGLAFSFATRRDDDRYSRALAARRGTHPAGKQRERGNR